MSRGLSLGLSPTVVGERFMLRRRGECLGSLGKLYVKAGVKPGAGLVRKILKVTGMSFRWVMAYLPDKLKERPGVGESLPERLICQM